MPINNVSKLRMIIMVVIFAISSILLTSCSSNEARSMAKQACSYVNLSIKNYEQGVSASNPKSKSQLFKNAYIELRDAVSPAADAAGNDTRWQALATTVSESARVPEKYLISALTSECQSVNYEG